MPEFGLVEGIVGSVIPALRASNIQHVSKVHFRRASIFSEAALRQAYQAITLGTPLEGAALVIDTINLDYTCLCGYQQIITVDDLAGHLFICPLCGAIHALDEARDLELVEIIAEAN